jgi:hypothetical protein
VVSERRGVIVFRVDDGVEIQRRRFTTQPVVVADLVAMTGGGDDLLGGHTALENAETAARNSVVDEGELLDRLGGDEFLGGTDAGAPVRADDENVHGQKWWARVMSVVPVDCGISDSVSTLIYSVSVRQFQTNPRRVEAIDNREANQQKRLV